MLQVEEKGDLDLPDIKNLKVTVTFTNEKTVVIPYENFDWDSKKIYYKDGNKDFVVSRRMIQNFIIEEA